MKKIMFVLFSASLSFAVISANAQSQTPDPQTPSNQTPSTQTPDQDTQDTTGYAKGANQDRVKIKQSELPQAVRDAITNDRNGEYSGWQIGDTYRSSKDNTYSVQLKKGTEARTVKFDAMGKKVEAKVKSREE